MAGKITLDIHDVLQLYGPALYRVGGEVFSPQEMPASPTPEAPLVETPATPVTETTQQPDKPGIVWRLKDTAPKILFVLQAAEFKNKELTDLLKKIVESLGIAAELVSFGSITGPFTVAELDAMPAPIAVLFDQTLLKDTNPQAVKAGEVFYSHPLAALSVDNALKRILWEYLKQVQPKLA